MKEVWPDMRYECESCGRIFTFDEVKERGMLGILCPYCRSEGVSAISISPILIRTVDIIHEYLDYYQFDLEPSHYGGMTLYTRAECPDMFDELERKGYTVQAAWDPNEYRIYPPQKKMRWKNDLPVVSGNAKPKESKESEPKEKKDKSKRRPMTRTEKRDLRDTAALGISFAGLMVSIASLTLAMNKKPQKGGKR